MKILKKCGIPIGVEGSIRLSMNQDGYTMLQKYNPKYKDVYDLIDAAKKGDEEANILLEKLWQNKCFLYWNYKNKCDNPSFLYDYILFHYKKTEEQNIRINSYASKNAMDDAFIEPLFKKMQELVERSCTIIRANDNDRFQCIINQDAIVKLCEFINQGVDENYREHNNVNVEYVFKKVEHIVNNYDGMFSKYRISIYSEEFQDLSDINIMLPVEGMVSGIYLLEVYHSSNFFRNIVYSPINKGLEDRRNVSVRNSGSTSSSMEAKFIKNSIGSFKLPDGKKVSKRKKASKARELIQDLYDYTNYRNYEKDEEPKKLLNIIDTIRKLPIEYSLYESLIDDCDFKRAVFFRSELLRHIVYGKNYWIWYLKNNIGIIFENMDKVDSAVRRNLKVILDTITDYDDVIRLMNNVKERVEEQLPEIKYYDFKLLEDEDSDLENICIKAVRWINYRYTAKILYVSREQSDHVRQIKFPEPTDKQKKMFKEALIDYKWLLALDNSWLNEYLGIDNNERIKLDDKVNRFIKKINNGAIVGSKCEPDNIQKIIIYQLCASEDSLHFSSDREYYISGRKKEGTLKKIIDPKAKQDVKVSIWLNALMRKQFYVNLGYEEVFDITEDCHNLIADGYEGMLETGLFCTYEYNEYNKELDKIINNLI